MKKIQENPLVFDWSMVLSKSDLRDPLNPLSLVQKKILFTYKIKLFVPIDHHAKFNIFKLSFCDLIKMPILLKPLFGALPKICVWIWKYVQIRHGF